MFNISHYLEKFKKLRVSRDSENEAILTVLKEQGGVTLLAKDIVLKEGKLSVQAHPIIKSQLRMKKAVILKGISEKLGKPVIDLF